MKVRARDVLLTIGMLAVVLMFFAYSPEMVVLALYFFLLSLLLFGAVHLLTNKWYLSVALPALLLCSYLLFWNELVTSVFAIIVAIMASMYLAAIFSYRMSVLFAFLLTALDVIMVLGPHPYMIASAVKALSLGLPTFVAAPTFPAVGVVRLGVGDFLLSNLLVVESFQKHQKCRFRGAALCALSIAGAFAVFSVLQRNWGIRFLPATPPILCGWLAATFLLSKIGFHSGGKDQKRSYNDQHDPKKAESSYNLSSSSI